MVEAQQLAASVDDHTDRIKADRACGWALALLVAQPGNRQPS
jgi:hypothetical protein